MALMRLASLLFLVAFSASAQSIPAAVSTDPPIDKKHPAKMSVLHIPSHGVLINGLVYQPSGAGPHPTLVIFHGLPGNEKNLDLAQAVRRAGWNAVTFNYRGSWGSPGSFRFAQNLEDADAVLAFLRDPAKAQELGIDPLRIAIAGHSMGGWVAVHTASHDKGLIGTILISAADMGRMGRAPAKKLEGFMADDMESLAGVTAAQMAEELNIHSSEWGFDKAVPGLVDTRLLVLSADDGLARDADALVKAIQEKGGHKVQAQHVVTDHSWSDHRIALETIVINWLTSLP